MHDQCLHSRNRTPCRSKETRMTQTQVVRWYLSNFPSENRKWRIPREGGEIAWSRPVPDPQPGDPRLKWKFNPRKWTPDCHRLSQDSGYARRCSAKESPRSPQASNWRPARDLPMERIDRRDLLSGLLEMVGLLQLVRRDQKSDRGVGNAIHEARAQETSSKLELGSWTPLGRRSLPEST